MIEAEAAYGALEGPSVFIWTETPPTPNGPSWQWGPYKPAAAREMALDILRAADAAEGMEREHRADLQIRAEDRVVVDTDDGWRYMAKVIETAMGPDGEHVLVAPLTIVTDGYIERLVSTSEIKEVRND